MPQTPYKVFLVFKFQFDLMHACVVVRCMGTQSNQCYGYFAIHRYSGCACVCVFLSCFAHVSTFVAYIMTATTNFDTFSSFCHRWQSATTWKSPHRTNNMKGIKNTQNYRKIASNSSETHFNFTLSDRLIFPLSIQCKQIHPSVHRFAAHQHSVRVFPFYHRFYFCSSFIYLIWLAFVLLAIAASHRNLFLLVAKKEKHICKQMPAVIKAIKWLIIARCY